jgi:hypothetical protein
VSPEETFERLTTTAGPMLDWEATGAAAFGAVVRGTADADALETGEMLIVILGFAYP